MRTRRAANLSGIFAAAQPDQAFGLALNERHAKRLCNLANHQTVDIGGGMDCRQHQGAHLREEDPAFLRLVETAEDSGQAGARGLRAGIRGQAEKAARKIAVQLRKQEAVFRVRTQGGFKRGMPGCKSGKQRETSPVSPYRASSHPVYSRRIASASERTGISAGAQGRTCPHGISRQQAHPRGAYGASNKAGVGGLAGIERRKRRGKARQRARARAVKRRAGARKGSTSL